MAKQVKMILQLRRILIPTLGVMVVILTLLLFVNDFRKLIRSEKKLDRFALSAIHSETVSDVNKNVIKTKSVANEDFLEERSTIFEERKFTLVKGCQKYNLLDRPLRQESTYLIDRHHKLAYCRIAKV